MEITALELAERFIGMKEVKGSVDNPAIMAMLKLDNEWPSHDEVPWCSAFVNYIAWLLRLTRSKSLLAKSWVNVGRMVHPTCAKAGFDIVVLSRGSNPNAGHVGFYVDRSCGKILLLGGNHSDSVGLEYFDEGRILAYRKLERFLV